MNDDQENIKRLRALVEPCQRCGGRGYVDGLIEEREICGCINANLPLPEIVNGELKFKMQKNNA